MRCASHWRICGYFPGAKKRAEASGSAPGLIYSGYGYNRPLNNSAVNRFCE